VIGVGIVKQRLQAPVSDLFAIELAVVVLCEGHHTRDDGRIAEVPRRGRRGVGARGIVLRVDGRCACTDAKDGAEYERGFSHGFSFELIAERDRKRT